MEGTYAVFTRVDHIGIIVDNLSEAMEALGEGLGLELESEHNLPDQSLKAAFYHCGDTLLELIECTSDELRKRRLGEGNRARIEHVALQTGDVNAALQVLGARGIEVSGKPAQTGANLSTWTLPETTAGIRFQVLEKVAEA